MFGIKKRDAEISRLRGVVKRLNGFKTARLGVLGSCTGYVWAALESSLNGHASQEVISIDNGEYGEKFVTPPAPNVTLSRRMAERLVAECKWLYEKAGAPVSPDMERLQSIIEADTADARDRALAAADLS